jgi:DNA-directed RNA polymerase specialized sigma24 family protein
MFKILILTDDLSAWAYRIAGNMIKYQYRHTRDRVEIVSDMFRIMIRADLDETARAENWSCVLVDKPIDCTLEAEILYPSVRGYVAHTANSCA